MQVIETTYGEAIEVLVGRWEKATGEDQTDLLERVGTLADCSVNTMRALFALTDRPAGDKSVDRKRRARVYLLCLAVGVTPDPFDVSRADLPPALVDRSEISLREDLSGRCGIRTRHLVGVGASSRIAA